MANEATDARISGKNSAVMGMARLIRFGLEFARSANLCVHNADATERCAIVAPLKYQSTGGTTPLQ